MPRAKGAAGTKEGQQDDEPEQQQQVVSKGAAAAAEGEQEAGPAKKKRNNNPGIRVLGGRVYDSENGTTCHQCRQKTAEAKAKCTKCTLFFCPKCLENRYQEKVDEANERGGWACPRCRGDCNCSNCRKKQGKEATGQLAAIAKKAGFGSVKDLLDKNPNAKAIQLPKAAGPATGSGNGDEGASDSGGASEGQRAARRRQQQQKRKAAAEAADEELVADEELPPRKHAMPEAQPLAVHKAACAGSKRQRGQAWVADVPAVTALPTGQAGAELAVILEFLQVFGAKLQLRSPSLAAFAAELVQPPADAAVAGEDAAAAAAPLLCPSPDESLVAAVHWRLLDLVRTYWNVKSAAITPACWQSIMRGYYAASQLTQAQTLALRWQHGPPAVAGEIFSRPLQAEEEGCWEQEGSAVGPGEEAQGAGGAAAAAAVDYPQGGYWALPAAVRVSMLHALVHDALECDELRRAIEDSMGDALDEEKERRQQLAGVRKQARQAIARERDQQIALMIASADGSALTLEQQQAMLAQARQRAEAAAATAAAAKVKALTEKVHPPTVRTAVLGVDRDGRRFLQLQAAPLLTGGGGTIVQSAGPEGSCGSADKAAPAGTAAVMQPPATSSAAGPAEAFACYPSSSLAGVVAALHPQGRREGPLCAALLHAFKLPAPEEEAAPPASSADGKQSQAEQPSPVALPAAAGTAKPPAGRKRATSAAAQTNGTTSGTAAPAAQAPKPGVAGGRQQSKKKAAAGKAGSSSPAGDEAAAAGAVSAAARAAAGSQKRGRRSSSCNDGTAADAGSTAASAAAPAAKQRRAGFLAAAAAEEQATAQAAAKGKRSSRPMPLSGSSPGKAAALAAAAPGAATRLRKQAVQRLPLKVDDMLQAA